MSTTGGLTDIEMRILLRIVGARPGADSSAILTFLQTHKTPGVTADQVRDSLNRLVALGLVVERDGKYHSSPDVQAAFISECRNCSDTIEEFDILGRLVERRFGKRKG